jgi:hypothetical protein
VARGLKSMKQGQFDVARKTIYWMIAGIIITVVIMAFAFTLAGYRGKLTYVPAELRAEFIALRFVQNPDCFAWRDEFGVAHSGIIDMNKFTPERMNQCYLTESEKGYTEFNFRLVLEGSNKEIMSNNYSHKDDFTLYKEVLVRLGDGKITKDRMLIYVEEKI